VARASLKASNRTVGIFIPTAQPDRAAIPATPDLEALFKNYKSSVTPSGSTPHSAARWTRPACQS